MQSRRRFLAAAPVLFTAAALARSAAARPDLAPELDRLESASGGRLGVAVLDTATGALDGHRFDERFPMCSTFKALAAGAVLSRVDADKESLVRRVIFDRGDLLANSPVAEARLAEGAMSVAQACEAAITRSDNTAANLMLASLGGPEGFTAFVRGLGDQVTRLDRIEPDLNTALEGDPRDTTTPAAMAADLRKLVLGDVLSPPSRRQLKAWLMANKTGDARLRAAMPAGWAVGDKTGTGDHGTANDVAVVWPAARAPVVISVYLTGATVAPDRQNALIADVGRAVVGWLSAR